MLNYFRRRRTAVRKRKSVVPPEVATSIEAASFIERHFRQGENSDEMIPRVIVTGLPGGWPLLDDDDGLTRQISAVWPELNEEQIARAIRMLRATYRKRMASRPTLDDYARSRRKSFVHDWRPD